LGFLNALRFEFSGALFGIVVAGILFGATNGKAAMIAAVVGFVAVVAAERTRLVKL
jgi:hypothetical protein